MTAASVGPAVAKAARELKKKMLALVSKDESSPLYGLTDADIIGQNGRLVNRARLDQGQSYQDILKKARLDSLSAEARVETQMRGEGKDHCRNNEADDPSCYSFHSFGAQFAEVAVDPVTGQVRVTRFVGAYDVGRILNEKTARSQGLGGVVMGIGMALMEVSERDPKNGRVVTRNLADYHMPVHADVQNIDILFTDIPDPHFNELGSRGLGELPIVSSAAAIANAVYHATGKRIRHLPITPDKLI
jgi:xanthine dehydrogenase YagR molybdenum-binding subunit